MKQSSTTLSGRISKNYQVPPGSRIVLEPGAVFGGEDVGGQILYNNSDESMSFTINDGSLELAKISSARFVNMKVLSENDFLTPIVPLSEFVLRDGEEVSISGDSQECTLHVPLISTT